MSEIVERTKELIALPSREQGIKQLLKLQMEATEKNRHIPRLACLSLMEMQHDWHNIRKLIVEWRLVSKFGRDLVIRMRKRVNEEPGHVAEDADTIVQELDRLNEKNWRQYSPKKNFPDYAELLQPKVVREPNRFSVLPVIKQETTVKQHSQNSKISDVNSIFSKIQNGAKSEKGKDLEFLTKGVFSKISHATSQKVDNRQDSVHKILDAEKLVPKLEPSLPDLSKYNQTASRKEASPLKKPMIVVHREQKGPYLDETENDEFSFSAVKSMQVPLRSERKATPSKRRQADLDNSFMNFTQQSLKATNNIAGKNNDFLLELSIEKEKHSPLQSRRKPLFTEQELSLIEPHIPPKNNIKKIIEAELKSPIEMLRLKLKSM